MEDPRPEGQQDVVEEHPPTSTEEETEERQQQGEEAKEEKAETQKTEGRAKILEEAPPVSEKVAGGSEEAPASATDKAADATTTMRAVIYRRYGTDPRSLLEVTAEHPRPRITKKNEVLVQVHATSINPVDWKMMAGNLSLVQFGKIFPFVPCFDVSGVVVDVGTAYPLSLWVLFLLR